MLIINPSKNKYTDKDIEKLNEICNNRIGIVLGNSEEAMIIFKIKEIKKSSSDGLVLDYKYDSIIFQLSYKNMKIFLEQNVLSDDGKVIILSKINSYRCIKYINLLNILQNGSNR